MNVVTDELVDRLRRLPKAEIHVHLEGCFERSTLVDWAAEANVPLPRPADRLFEFAGLADFLEFLDWASGLASTTERLRQLAYEFCQRLARDGTGYADLIVNPSHWAHWRNRIPEMIVALDAGFTKAEQEGLPPVGLCISILRTQSAAEAEALVALLITTKHPRVVALSIDGNEAAAGRTGPRFASAFARAREMGLRRTVHAGESSGPEGVIDAIQLLQADRIDHGVRAIDDPAVVTMLAADGIALGICPSSNVSLGVYPSIAAHPIDLLRRKGVRVSINTDDPSLLGTGLPLEYAKVIVAFDWDDATIRDVARTSIDASFAPEGIKTALLKRLANW